MGWLAFLTALMLVCGTGCGAGLEAFRENRKSDTVVFIPIDPVQESGETQTWEMPGQTASATMEPTASPETSCKPDEYVGSEQVPTQPTVPQESEIAIQTTPESEIFDISAHTVGLLETQIFESINGVRTQGGIQPVRLDSRLSAIASVRARELSKRWSHTRPDGRNFTTIAEDYGYGGGLAAEILFYQTAEPTAETVVQSWMGGDSQRENLLSTGVETVGIGVYRGGGLVYIACLLTG